MMAPTANNLVPSPSHSSPSSSSSSPSIPSERKEEGHGETLEEQLDLHILSISEAVALPVETKFKDLTHICITGRNLRLDGEEGLEFPKGVKTIDLSQNQVEKER